MSGGTWRSIVATAPKMSGRNWRSIAAAVLLVQSLFAPHGVRGEICAFTGTVDDLWSEVGNWNCSHLPQPTDSVYVSGVTLTLDTAATVRSIVAVGSTTHVKSTVPGVEFNVTHELLLDGCDRHVLWGRLASLRHDIHMLAPHDVC